MLKVTVNAHGPSEVEANGSGIEILSELSYVIHDIYSGLYHHDKKIARSFRHMFLSALTAPDSPVWVPGKHEGQTVIISTNKPVAEGES